MMQLQLPCADASGQPASRSGWSESAAAWAVSWSVSGPHQSSPGEPEQVSGGNLHWIATRTDSVQASPRTGVPARAHPASLGPASGDAVPQAPCGTMTSTAEPQQPPTGGDGESEHASAATIETTPAVARSRLIGGERNSALWIWAAEA